MAKKKSFKTALVMAILSIVVCLSMFAGTTFAWFTDSVTSTNNVIQSGTLKIAMQYDNDETSDWTDFTSTTNVFKQDARWEPGHVEVIKFKIKNVGTLDLKYQLKAYIDEEIGSTNVNGVDFKLSDFIKYAVIEGDQNYDREAAVNAANPNAVDLSENYVSSLKLGAGKERIVTMVVYMPTTVGNDANAMPDAPVPTINLGIALNATQVEAESDSFGSDYDAGAPWMGDIDTAWYFEDTTADTYTIDSAEELAGFAAIVNGTAEAPVTGLSTISASTNANQDTFKGKTVKLGGNIDLNGLDWTPIGRIGKTSTDFAYSFKGTFDGQGYIVSNLNVSNIGWAGLFGIAHQAEINNVKINNVKLESSRMTGSVVGQLYGSIDNCHVNNVNITVVPNWDQKNSKFDNGDKVGGIVGWLGDNGNNRHLTNSSATNVNIIGYRDIGGIVGYVASSTTISGCKVDTADLESDQVTNHYGDKDANVGAIWGRKGGDIIESNNTAENVTASYSEDGIEYKKDGEGNVILYLVPAGYNNDTVVVSEGVTAIGNYAFASNNNVKTVELSSTVRTLGRGFDSSTVEKVVLNEGLEVIDSRAFRRTNNLKEVVISSTVKTVADNAFQSSAIKNIVFPENVTYVGDSCFTAATVESVTFMGKNVEIAHYAFRDCPNLKTVTILADAITLGDGMIFTNSQNNNQDPNNITVYVKNEDVKKAIVDNGTFKGAIVVMSDVVDEPADIENSFSDNADTVYVSAGTYTFPSSSIRAGDVVICAEGTVFEGNSKLNIGGATVKGATFSNPTGTAVDQTINGTFVDCTFYGSNGLRWCYAGETVVFENCVFDGAVYGVHFDGGANNVLFKNCTISGFNAMGGAITNLKMEGCTFKANGRSGYNGINLWGNTELTDCTFIFDGSVTEWIDACGDNTTITVNNCVVTDGTNEKDIKTVIGNYGTGNTITVDGDYLAWSASEFNSAVEAGATTVYLLGDAEVDLNGNQKDGLNIIGIGDNVKVANTTNYASGKSVGAIWKAIHLKNVTITNTVYTMADGGNATFEKVNFAAGVRQAYGKNVVFTDCTFGSNSEGYALHFQTDSASEGGNITIDGCKFEGGKVHLGGKRAYTFTGCDFAAGTDFQVWSNITLSECTVDGVAVTAENVATLFPNLDLTKVSFN
ncbi:MAG: leucine-rich repeat protein [Clostridia bacterium]|nr:leucine-rich repeat protein [Clostridia bacterium]